MVKFGQKSIAENLAKTQQVFIRHLDILREKYAHLFGKQLMILREIGIRSNERRFDIRRFHYPKALRRRGRTGSDHEKRGTKNGCLAADRHRLFPRYFLPYGDQLTLAVYRKVSFAQTEQRQWTHVQAQAKTFPTS